MNQRIPFAFSCFALLTIGGGWLFAEPPGAKSSKAPTSQQIEKWLRDLDDNNFAVREQAHRELLQLQERALAPLHAALKMPHSLEFRYRAEKILKALAIFEPGGEVVGGLKLRLTVNRDAVRLGEKVLFTIGLANMTDKSMNREIDNTPFGNFFECGALLHRRSADGKDERPKWVVDFFTPEATVLLTTLSAKSVLQIQLPGKLIMQHGKVMLSLGASDCLVQPLDDKGPNTFRVVYQQQAGGVKLNTPSPDAPYWNGLARSNDVVLKIVP
jgi:hypothetical protein